MRVNSCWFNFIHEQTFNDDLKTQLKCRGSLTAWRLPITVWVVFGPNKFHLEDTWKGSELVL